MHADLFLHCVASPFHSFVTTLKMAQHWRGPIISGGTVLDAVPTPAAPAEGPPLRYVLHMHVALSILPQPPISHPSPTHLPPVLPILLLPGEALLRITYTHRNNEMLIAGHMATGFAASAAGARCVSACCDGTCAYGSYQMMPRRPRWRPSLQQLQGRLRPRHGRNGGCGLGACGTCS